MLVENQYPLTAYQEISPLCEKGHIMLVQNMQDQQLYVKKVVSAGNLGIYLQLKGAPVPHTPVIYGIYGENALPEAEDNTGSPKNFTGNSLTIIEEYISGSTLAEHLANGRRFSEKEVIDIAMKLCKILMKLHGMKPAIVHRDIKPANVMLSSDGTVTLLDFNAAKTENPCQSRDTVLLGTAGFAAPEQYGFSASSHQTDIYGLGVLMNLLLTRKMPTETIASGKLKRIIRLCIQVNPKDRYQDVWELYGALRRTRSIRIQWLPPGFRSLKIYYMLPALLGYSLLFTFTWKAGYENYTVPYELFQFYFMLLVFAFINIMFYGDYLGIRRYFPFMRSPKRWRRALGFVLVPAAASFLIMFVLILIEIVMAVL